MSINSPEQFEKLRACGMIVRKALRAMAAEVRAGITTAELCELGSRVLAAHGARSSPPMAYGFPGDVCISVNDEVVHGIPGDRVMQRGDLVKLDLSAEKDGYHTDSAVSIAVAPGNGNARELARCAERAFRQALGAGGKSHEGHRPRRGARSAPARFSRGARTRWAWHRANHSRAAVGAQFGGFLRAAQIDRRPGHHHRADYCRHGRCFSRSGRLDLPHGGRQSLRALRAYHCD